MLIALALVAWSFAVTRQPRTRIVDIQRGVDIEGRAALAALMPFFYRCNSCCHVNRHQIIAKIETMYNMLECTADGDVIYPDFFGGFSASNNWLEPGSDRLETHIVVSKLEYARAHEAFSYLVAEPGSYSFAEFSFAQLLETQRRIEAIINEREGCIYAHSVHEIRIVPSNNILIIRFIATDLARIAADLGLESRDSGAIIAGFRQYVYDSPMIDFELEFHLSLSGGSASPHEFLTGIIVAVITLVAPALYLVRHEVKRKSANKYA